VREFSKDAIVVRDVHGLKAQAFNTRRLERTVWVDYLRSALAKEYQRATSLFLARHALAGHMLEPEGDGHGFSNVATEHGF